MADRVLFIGWSTPVRGREERGLEVFNEAIGICGRMQQEGRNEGEQVVNRVFSGVGMSVLEEGAATIRGLARSSRNVPTVVAKEGVSMPRTFPQLPASCPSADSWGTAADEDPAAYESRRQAHQLGRTARRQEVVNLLG